MNLRKSKTSKLVAGLIGFSMVLSLFVGVGVQTAGAQGTSLKDLVELFISLGIIAPDKAAQARQAVGGGDSMMTGSYEFNVNLSMGMTHPDVKQLQMVLNADSATQVAASGAGSPGAETTYFGARTKAAVVKFQIANGISPASGFVGPITRAKLNSMSAPVTPVPPATPVPPGTPPPPAGSGAVTVSAAAQPANSLAPAGGARVPFTKITLTAGATDVKINSITVERGGLADDAAFSGIVLLGPDGTQIGIAKTLNSNHQAMIGEPWTIKAGTSQTLTVAANMATTLTNYAGQVAQFSVVSVNTADTVSGSLPIAGALHTINASLTIGTVTMQRGGSDPGSGQTKEIGTLDYAFSSVRVTAGSAEKVLLRSIRWNQTGSAGSGDMTNVKVYVDGTAYDAVISADGKYYTATFGSGIVIDKGFSKDLTIKGDITGGSGRTIDFDIAKRTDIDLVGVTFGYGITPPQTGSSVPTADTAAFSSSEDPWYDAAQVTVSAGTLTVSVDTGVPAQNIAVNVPNQPIGGFVVEARGEPISVGSLIFNLSTTTSVTSVSLVDQNGTVLAGPVDTAGAGTAALTFSSSITFPVGITKLQLKGKLSTSFPNNGALAASTTPSTQWTTVKGQNSGNTITPTPSSALTALTMTVKTGALTVTVSTQPTARNIVAGANQFEFARYIFDASQSGEDVRITTIPLYFDTTGTRTDLTNCQLLDGATSVTSGSNRKNPATADTASSTSFTFDGTGLTVTKQTSKTLSLRCDLKTGTNGNVYFWGIDANQNSSFTGAQGLSSGQTVAETFTDSSGQRMTATTGGSYTVTSDTSLQYKMAQAGATDVTLARFRFEAGTSEDILLKAIALELGNVASNSPADLVGQKVSIYNGSTWVGDAQFGLNSPDNATSTLATPVLVAKGESVTLTVKGNLSAQNSTEGTPGAFLAVTYDGANNGSDGNYATGVDSSSTVSGGTTSDVTTNGLRIFRTVPSIAVTSNGGTLAAGTDLYKFTITNPNNRDVVFKKLTLSIATTGGNTNGFILYGDGVAFNNSTSTVGSETAIVLASTGTTQAAIVPANSSKTYVLKASTAVDTASVSESINLALLADTSYPSLANLMAKVTTLGTTTAATSNIIWSPFSTTTPESTVATEDNLDWTNGYGMPGFPAAGQNFPVQTWTRAN